MGAVTTPDSGNAEEPLTCGCAIEVRAAPAEVATPAAVDSVGATLAAHSVVASIAGEAIVTISAEDPVPARPTLGPVVPRSGEDPVIPAVAEEAIVAALQFVTDHVGTPTPVDDITVAFLVPPDEAVGTTVTDEDVGAHAAPEVLNRDQLIEASTGRATGGQVGDDRTAVGPVELHEVPTGTTIQHVIAGATDEPVPAGPAVEPITTRSSLPDGVIAATTLEDVVAHLTVQVITAPTSTNPVVATSTVDVILDRSARELVIARLTDEMTTTSAGAHHVVAWAGTDQVVAATATDHVRACSAEDHAARGCHRRVRRRGHRRRPHRPDHHGPDLHESGRCHLHRRCRPDRSACELVIAGCQWTCVIRLSRRGCERATHHDRDSARRDSPATDRAPIIAHHVCPLHSARSPYCLTSRWPRHRR